MNVALALGNCDWEAELVSHLGHPSSKLKVIRRCVDGVDLLAAIQVHQIDLVVISDNTLRFDASVLDQLVSTRVTVVAISSKPRQWNSLVQIRIIELDLKKLHLLPQQILEVATEPELSEVISIEPEGSITCVASFGGGVGRSLVARELAFLQSRQVNPTLLVEADSHGSSLAQEFDLPPHCMDLFAVYQSELFAEHFDIGTNFLSVVAPNFAVIPGVNVSSTWLSLRKSRLEKMWLGMRNNFDVVVDTGPHFSCLIQEANLLPASSPDLAAQTAVASAQKIIFCANASEVSVLRLVTGLIENQEELRNHEISVVLNRCHGSIAKDYSQLIRRHTGVDVVAMLPEDTANMQKVQQKRELITRTWPKSEISRALANLTERNQKESGQTTLSMQQKRLSRTNAA